MTVLPAAIAGTTATQIAQSVRGLIERGALAPGEALPSVRSLAAELGVNRNTVVAAYRQLGAAGLVRGRGRGGTQVADPAPAAQEGFAQEGFAAGGPAREHAVRTGAALRDVGTGNPDPARIPDITAALSVVGRAPVLYGEPVIDAQLESWAQAWMRDALDAGVDFRLSVTGGASDAIDRLLSQSLTRDDAVALEDPCFLTSLNTVRLCGYRPVPVPVDGEGMTVAGLRAALDEGVRALVCTPRAQNPTGASLSAARARALREVLAEHPYVLVIEDDHFSLLSSQPFRSLIAPGRRRFALVRSVSKFLGPDMGVALVASDPETAERLALRLSRGATGVSHLLQRLVHAQLTSPSVRAQIEDAGRHYAARNAAFVRALSERGIDAEPGDGLSVWVPLSAPVRDVADILAARGWLVRSGDDFAPADPDARGHLRLTIHDLSDAEAQALASELAAADLAASSESGTHP